MTRVSEIYTLGIANTFIGGSTIIFATHPSISNMQGIPFMFILGTLCATWAYAMYRFIIA